MKTNYEVNIYSHNTNEYLCFDNYFESLEAATENFNNLKATLIPGEELMLYKRVLDDEGNEEENEIVLYAKGEEIAMDKVEHSFKHGDYFVFMVNDRIFIVDTNDIYRHPKEGTIEFQNCSEVDWTCFEEQSGEYFGETLPESHSFIIWDTYADYPNQLASVYYQDEIVEER